MVLTVGLTFPFYGGDAFGLHAIGQEAVNEQNVALVSLASVVRSGPGLVLFGVELLLLAMGAIMIAMVIWRSGVLSKWGGVPFALGFALFIPQFYATQPIRVAHGILVAVGCLWIAVILWLQGATPTVRKVRLRRWRGDGRRSPRRSPIRYHNYGQISSARVQASSGAQPTTCSRYGMPSFLPVEVLLKAQQRPLAGSPSLTHCSPPAPGEPARMSADER
jgi:hypothetical protein